MFKLLGNNLIWKHKTELDSWNVFRMFLDNQLKMQNKFLKTESQSYQLMW